MEHQQLLALQLRQSKRCAATLFHNGTIGRISRQHWLQQHCCYVLNMSINGASMIEGFASWMIKGLCSDLHP